MRSGAWTLTIAAVALAGCFQSPAAVHEPPGVEGASTSAPERHLLLTGAAAWTFEVRGPSNFIGLNLTEREGGAAALVLFDPEVGSARLVRTPSHGSLVQTGGTPEGVLAGTGHDAGADMWVHYYGTEWFNRTIYAFAIVADDKAGAAAFELALSGADVVLTSHVEEGPAVFIPSHAWAGQRVVIRQHVADATVGAHASVDLRTSWRTQNGTLAVYVSPEYIPTLRYEELRLSSPNASWYHHRIAERWSGLGVRVGSERDNASFRSDGFILMSEETEWRLDVRKRLVPNPVYDAVLVADLRPSFLPKGTQLL